MSLHFTGLVIFLLAFSREAVAQPHQSVKSAAITVPAATPQNLAPAASMPVITAGPVSGAISACAGSASQSPLVQQFTVSGSNLTGNITLTAPPNGQFEISHTAAGGYTNSVTLTQAGGQVSSNIVYVRSSPAAPAGNLSGNITLASPGAVSQMVAVTGTVSALPVVNAVASQTVTAENASKAINFTGTGNAYTWVNDTPAIGLAASGSGDIPSFTAVNGGSTPVTATITVTPAMAPLAYITNSASGNISVINTLTNQVSATITGGTYPFGVAVSPDQRLVYVTNQGTCTVNVISTSTNTVLATIPVGDGNNPSSLVVSPDGSKVYALNALGVSLSVINTATNSITAIDKVGGQPYGIVITPDGSRIYVANVSSSNVYVINTSNNQTIATIDVPKDPTGLAISPDGSTIYVANQGANIVSAIAILPNGVSGQVIMGPPPTGVVLGWEPTGLVVSPDGSRLYVTNFGANTVSVINTATLRITGTITVGLEPYGLSVSRDGSRLYVANRTSNDVSVINTVTNQVIKTIGVGTTPYAFGNFIADYAGCSGAPVKFTITVNPNTAPAITHGTVTGSITGCQGAPSESPHIEQFTVSGIRLTAGITATAPQGFEVSLAPADGYAGSVTVSSTGAAINNTVVYVRSAAAASQAYISGNVVLSSAGAASQDIAVSGTISQLAVDPVPNQAVASGALTTAINFTGIGSTFSWVNNKPGIGLAASGSGNIPPFTAINKSKTPVTATITVTPLPAPMVYISNSTDGTVTVINKTTNKIITTISADPGKYTGYLAVSPDGSKAYLASFASNKIVVINTATNSVLANIPVGVYPSHVVVSNDGSRVYVTNNGSDNITVIDAITNTVITNVPIGSNPGNMVLTPNGRFLYVTYGEDDIVISVVDTRTNTVIANIPSGYWYYGLAVSPDGSTVYAIDNTTNTISVINTTTNTITANLSIGLSGNFGAYEMEISPDGSRLYLVNNYDDSIDVVSTSSGSTLTTIRVGKSPSGASVTADGKLLYVGNSGDNTVSVINTETYAVTNLNVGAGPLSNGNIISQGPDCPGQSKTFTITVNSNDASGLIDVPTAFTPNNDGINDTWDIKNIGAYPDCTVMVYNRYGQNVLNSIGYGTAWGGTYKGAALPAGTYYFIIDLKNGTNPVAGFVAIIR